jgi:hypothetical protein
VIDWLYYFFCLKEMIQVGILYRRRCSIDCQVYEFYSFKLLMSLGLIRFKSKF